MYQTRFLLWLILMKQWNLWFWSDGGIVVALGNDQALAGIGLLDVVVVIGIAVDVGIEVPIN